MFELFKSEFLRYRKWAIIAFVGQMAVWAFVAKIKPLLAPESAQSTIIMLFCVLGGVSFGAVQMVLNRRKNNWTYLIQRPVKTNHIYAALSGAAIVNMMIAVPLAWVVVVLGLDAFTDTVVDMRHYVFALFMLGTALTAYLIGSIAILSASKGAFALIFIMILWVFPKPESMTIYFTFMALVCGGLWYLNLKSFKPDLNTHVKTPLYTVLMGLPMQMALAIVLMISSTVYYHIPRFIIGNHPDNNPVEGSMSYLWNVGDKKLVEYLLKDQDIPNKERLSRQAELADADYVDSDIWTYPSAGQMPIRDKGYGLYDEATRTRWIFSNDKMLMQGSDATSGKISGWIGKNGFIDIENATEEDRFDSVPFLVSDMFLATPKRLYQVNYEDQELIVKFEAPTGTTLVSPPQVTDQFVALVTEENLYMFDKEDFMTEMEPADANYTIPHPLALEKVRNMETRRMVDGYIVIYFSRHYNGFQREAVSMHYAKLGRGVELIAKTDFHISRHPPIIDNLDYTISPALYMLNNQMFHILEPSEKGHASFSEVWAREYQPSVKWTALFLQIISALGGFFMARRIKLNRTMTGVWTVMCAVFSLPALVSFFLMNKVRGE